MKIIGLNSAVILVAASFLLLGYCTPAPAQELRLIATHYPTLAAECEYQSWLIDTPERTAA